MQYEQADVDDENDGLLTLRDGESLRTIGADFDISSKYCLTRILFGFYIRCCSVAESQHFVVTR
jgi:hypothetical protein